ncbi:MAG: MFS transporter, partial [Chloroflexi bacterium]|nr:MFS transporter [Chloroflexota bacterium]
RLLAGSLGNLLINVSFGGAVANFFPVYAAQIGLVQVAINSMFSVRAFGSTLARLPTGAITNRIPSRLVMYAALIVSMAAVFFMSRTNSAALLGLLLLLEGLSFGAFLTSGQVFVAESSTPTTRGAAVGVYSTAGSVGSMLSSIALGMAADLWGVQVVFRLTALLLLIGLTVIGYLYLQREPLPRSECAVQGEATQ